MSQRRSHCRRLFQLSGYKPEQKPMLSNQITSLGGVHCDNEHFLSESTHIVCRKPSRSEKFLGGLATGKWLLTTNYIQDSYQHGRWLPEVDYEWGPKWKECVPGDLDAQCYLKAPAKWRKRIQETQQGPFAGWKVALFVEPAKKTVYKRLLRLGCADVMEIQLPIKNANIAQQLTHVFVEDKFAKDVEMLARHGVLCLKPMYIGAFLLLETPPNPDDHMVLKVINSSECNSASSESGASKAVNLRRTSRRSSPVDENATPVLSQGTTSTEKPSASGESGESNTISSRKITRRSSSVNGATAGASNSNTKTKSNNTQGQVMKRSTTMTESLESAKVKKERNSSSKEEKYMSGLFTPIGRSSTPVNVYATPVKSCPSPIPYMSQETKDSKSGLTPSKFNNTPSKSKKPLVSHFKGTPSPSKENTRRGKKKFDVSSNRSMFEFITRTPRSGSSDNPPGCLESTPFKSPIKNDTDATPFLSNGSTDSPQPIVIQPLSDSQEALLSQPKSENKTGSIKCGTGRPKLSWTPPKANRKSRRLESVKTMPEKYRKMLGKKVIQVQKTEAAATVTSSSESAAAPNDDANNDADDDDDDVIITKYIPSPNKKNVAKSSDSGIATNNDKLGSIKLQPVVRLHDCFNATTNAQNSTKSQPGNHIDSLETMPCAMDTETSNCVDSHWTNGTTSTDYVSENSREPRGLKRKLDSAMVYNAMKKIKLDEVKPQGRFHHPIPSCPFSERFESETNVRLPLGMVMSSLVEAPMEENKVAVGVDQLLLILSTKHYPSVAVLRTLLRKGFLDAQSTSDTDTVYSCLHHILLLHPPITPVLQQMYLDALQLQEEGDFAVGEPWDILINSFSIFFEDQDRLQVIYSNIKLFKFIIAVLQRDFQHAFASGCNNKLRRTIISRLVWPSGQVGIFNSRCQKLLSQCADILQMNEDDFQAEWKVTKTELVGSVLSLITMIGEVCYVAGKQTRPCLLEETPENAAILARELAFRLKDIKSSELLETVFSSIQSPWLVIIVIEVMLSNFDSTLVKTGEDVTSVITLQKIVSQYMFMLPTSSDSNVNVSRLPSTNSSICNTPRMLSPLKNPRVPLTPIKQIVIATPMSSSQRKKVVDVNKKNMKGETALHRACIQNKVAKVKELLATPGIDINLQDNSGWTALHEAANHGHVQCVKELLNYKPANTIMSYFKTVEKRGLNLLAAAEDGTTPLHDAIMNNHVEVAMLILEKGGDKLLKAQLKNGALPEELAFSMEMKDALHSFKMGLEKVATPGKLRSKLHFFSESQDPDETDINFSQLSQGEPDFGPSDDLYEEVLGDRSQSCFSEEVCLRLLLLIQRLCVAYLNFYKLNLVALTLKEGHNHEGHPVNQGQHAQEPSVFPVKRSTRNKDTSELVVTDSSKENAQNAHVTRLLEDLRVCQKFKYHLQDFKSHLLKISGRANLDFCKGQLVALDTIFRI